MSAAPEPQPRPPLYRCVGCRTLKPDARLDRERQMIVCSGCWALMQPLKGREPKGR